MKQIRPFYTEEELETFYKKGVYRPDGFVHNTRVWHTIGILEAMMENIVPRIRTVADLSCGDGTILGNYFVGKPYTTINRVFVSDYNAENAIEAERRIKNVTNELVDVTSFKGKIEHILTIIPETDLLLCTETLEHLEDPKAMLRLAAGKFKYIVLSTPLDEKGDANPGHYWSWNHEDIKNILEETGWTPMIYSSLFVVDPRTGLDFQLWTAKITEKI